nr:uncharacterized protein LOC109183154 [Ipomoea batatas]
MTYHPRRGREERKTNPGNKPHSGPRIPPWAPAPPSGKTPHLVPFNPLRAPPNDILAYAEECHIVRTPYPRPDPPGAGMSKSYLTLYNSKNFLPMIVSRLNKTTSFCWLKKIC